MFRDDIETVLSEGRGKGVELARSFIAGLPSDLTNGGGGSMTTSEGEKGNIISYLRRESYMLRELMDNPGTYRMPECIYKGEGTGWVDNYLSMSPSGQALHDRILAVVNGTEKAVSEKIGNGHDKVKIINMGSGTGRDTVEMIKRNSQWNGSVHVQCVDLDREALDSGKEFARTSGVENLEFVEANILSLPHREEFDMGLLIGVLCGIPVPRCVAILKKIRPYFKKGGVLIASNVTTTMAEEDTFMSYILDEFVGWKLVYKTPQQMQYIFERAGYEWMGCFYDEPHRFHCMGMGEVV